MLEDIYNLPIGLGSISACEAVVSEALSVPVKDAHGYIQKAAKVNADETGWRQGKQRAWLWVAVTTYVTVFMINLQRGKEAARMLLGPFDGLLGSDRWNAYNIHRGLRQLCWAHLKRKFVEFSEMHGEAGRIGQLLLDKTRLMFKWWHAIRDGTMKRKMFQKKMIDHQEEMRELLIDGVDCGHAKMARVCIKLLKVEEHLWTFVNKEGVEPTNNAAEQAIRKGVLWRKTSFGTQSEAGSRFVERVMTVTETCRQQNRNILEYITTACEARLHNRPAPSLLPV
jgi:transposase